MSAAARRKAIGLAISFLYATLFCLGLAFPSYARTAGRAFLLAHLTLGTLLSLSFLRHRLLLGDHRPGFLGKLRRWVTDDYPESN